MQDQSDLNSRLSRIEDQLDSLRGTIESINQTLWKKVGDHEARLPVVEDRVNDLRKIGWMIMSAILAQFVTAIWAVIMLKHG